MKKLRSVAPLLSDRAADRDLLDFTPYTQTLLDVIRDPKTEGPLVIGLFGTWGSGKTSLMRFVQNDLAGRQTSAGPSFRLAWFDAWKYEKEDALWRALLLRVVDNLRSRDAAGEDTTEKELRKEIERLEQRLYRDVEWEEKGGLTVDWSKFAKGAAKGAIQIAFGFLPGLSTLTKAVEAAQEATGQGESAGDLIEAFRRDVVEHHQAQLRSLEQFQAEFGKLVQTHIVRKNQRLVVFVDDLDRCLPEKAIEVLEAIKLFLDVPGCIFLLGLDQEVVARGIKVKYRQFAVDEGKAGDMCIPIDGAAYLEKIIQLPFRLPKIEPGAMRSFVQGLAAFADPRCEDVFAEGLETNPRKVKRAINIFLFISRLAGKRNIPSQPVRLAKIVVIYHSHPELYERLRLNPALLRVLEDYLRSKRPQAQAHEQRPGAQTEATVEAAEPPPVPGHLLTDDLKRVLLLFHDQPDACFHELDYAELQSYFTLTRGTIAQAPPQPAPSARSTTSLAFPVPTLVRIPAGKFTMGSSDDDIKRLVAATDWAKEWQKKGEFKREQPQHEVELGEYRIGKYPVTNAEYRAFVEEKKVQPPEHWSGGSFPEERAAHPVGNVSWDDARAYCQWLTEKLRPAGPLSEKQEIRLPTEAEWEKAARGDRDARFYPWGDEWDKARCNSAEGGVGDTTPVGKHSPAGDSPYGLADMAGNVWEWCADWFAEDYYRSSPEANPPGPDSGNARVLRGGAFFSGSDGVRCSLRRRLSPGRPQRERRVSGVASPFVSGR